MPRTQSSNRVPLRQLGLASAGASRLPRLTDESWSAHAGLGNPRELGDALALLGPIGCLFPMPDQHPLEGWRRARFIGHRVDICADSVRESLQFIDDEQQPCWQLFRLPDSCYAQWDRICATTPEIGGSESVCGGLLAAKSRRLAARRRWRGCVVQLTGGPDHSGRGSIAIGSPALSNIGMSYWAAIVHRCHAP